jgi:drug/metabolite transporter (DMT)-like permease
MKLAWPRLEAADLVMLGVVLMWAANNIVIKVTVGVLPPLPFVVARFLIVIALVWAWILVRRIPARIAARDIPLTLLSGISGFGIYNALFTIGMERTSAFSVAILVSLSPIFTMILARLMGIERPTRAQWLAVALSAAGVAVFVGDKMRAEGIGAATLGDLFGLIAALAFAIYSLAARPLTFRYGATVTTGWSVLVGLAAIAPWGMPAALAEPWERLTLPVWGALFYAAAIAMLVGYTLWAWAIARAGVTRTVPYLFLIPVITGVVSATALGETFSPGKLAGALMVLIGTTLVRVLGRGARAPAKASPSPSARLEVAAIDVRGGRDA